MEENTRIAESQGKFDPNAIARKLRDYKENDPEFTRAVAEFVSGEIENADPAEGVPYREAASDAGPAQSKIRELIGA